MLFSFASLACFKKRKDSFQSFVVAADAVAAASYPDWLMDFCHTSLLMDPSRLQWFDAAREELGWSESTTTELIKTFGVRSTVELIILAVRLDPRVGERIRQRRPSKTTLWFPTRLTLTMLPKQIQETETQLTKVSSLPESSATISGPEISVESSASPSSHTINLGDIPGLDNLVQSALHRELQKSSFLPGDAPLYADIAAAAGSTFERLQSKHPPAAHATALAEATAAQALSNRTPCAVPAAIVTAPDHAFQEPDGVRSLDLEKYKALGLQLTAAHNTCPFTQRGMDTAWLQGKRQENPLLQNWLDQKVVSLPCAYCSKWYLVRTRSFQDDNQLKFHIWEVLGWWRVQRNHGWSYWCCPRCWHEIPF